MSSTRSILFAALVLVGFLLWQAWQQDYETKTATSDAGAGAAPTIVAPGDSTEVPKPAGGAPAPAARAEIPSAESAAPSTLIEVRTDVLHVAIDTRGGTLAQADLLAYPLDPKDKTRPVRLLDDSP